MPQPQPKLKLVRYVACDVKRMVNVIDSCVTADQLMAARNYYHLYLRRLRPFERSMDGLFLSYYALAQAQWLASRGISTTPTPPEGA